MLIHLPVQVSQDSRPGLLSAVPTGLVGLSDPTQDCRPGLLSIVPAGLRNILFVDKLLTVWRTTLAYLAPRNCTRGKNRNELLQNQLLIRESPGKQNSTTAG